MADIDTIDVSHVKFTSTVFPTDEDMKLWHNLSPEQQREVIMNDIKQGLDGTPAKNSGKDEVMAEVLNEISNAL